MHPLSEKLAVLCLRNSSRAEAAEVSRREDSSIHAPVEKQKKVLLVLPWHLTVHGHSV